MSDPIKLVEEAIQLARQEGFAAGYAAAIEAMREFVTNASSSLAQRRDPKETDRVGSRKTPLGEGEYVPVERGANAMIVESALRGVIPRAIGPTEIQHIVAREVGKKLAYSSVRHALNQLQARDVAREVSAKRWRYIPPDERTKDSPRGPDSNDDSVSRPTGDVDPGGDAPDPLDLAPE